MSAPPDQENMETILSTVDDTTFDEEDWNDVAIACSSLADKWQQLCAYLGLSIKIIRTIRGNYPNDSAAAWNEALTLWVLQDYNTRRHGMPSWKTLLKAISKVDQPLFEKLAKEHQTLGKQEDGGQIKQGDGAHEPVSSKDADVTSWQIANMPEATSSSDTGYESCSVLSWSETSSSGASQLTKQVVLELKLPDEVVTQIKEKNKTLTHIHQNQCPCQLKNVASLELVEKQGKPDYSLEHQLSQHSSKGEWVRLSYTSLFKGDHSSRKLGNRILIVGEAGTEKSVLCALIADDWANGKLFQEFLMVLFLPLNQRSVASAKNLFELLQYVYEFDNKTCSAAHTYLMQNQEDNILIIADGWDELCESENKQDSFLHCLLFGELLPSSSLTIVVTSRPASVPQKFKGRFITLQGFSAETTKSYIEVELSSNSKKISYLTEQLATNPLVGSMCSVPLNLAMICNYCQSCDDTLPSTMPQLYEILAWSLAQSKINSITKYGQALKVSNYRDLPKELQQCWFQLCKLAFEECQAEFSQMEAASALASEVETFGLLKPVPDERGNKMLSFLYPAFRYYLAVSHLITQPQSIQLDIIKSMHCISPMFCRFYLSMNEKLSGDVVSEVIQTLSKLHHSCKDMCLISYESKNENVDQEIFKSLHTSGSTIMLHSQNAYECVAMVHVLEKIEQECSVEINFQNCNLKSIHISKLTSVLESQSKLIEIKGLDLSDNCLNDSIMADFFSRAVSSFRSLEKLFLRSCGIGAEGLSAIIDALAKSCCTSLTQLDLSFNSLSLSCLEYFQQHIDSDNMEKLEILMLKGSLAEGNCMSFLKHFATTLSLKCKYLRQLDLSANKLGACDDPDLCAIVSQLTASLGNSFDLRLDDDYMAEVENNFLTIMEESIRNKGTIDHTIAHGVIVGPGRSGKNTLMQRLMGEGPPDPNKVSPSTGVLENVIKVEVKKLCTVATAVSNLKWHRLEYDEEALELMMTTTKNYSQLTTVPKPVMFKYIAREKSKSKKDKKALLASSRDRKSKLTATKGSKTEGLENTDSVSVEGSEETSKYVFVYSSDMAPVELFKKAVKLRRMDALRAHLESSWSLYLTNTGGQIEFQEHLPLLVCGPSIFFVTFPLHHDLDKPYEVQYQYPDGSVKKYSSTPTLIQELLQTLATIYALDLTTIQVGDTDQQLNLKPKIFFIGTHKDCIPGPDSKKTISQIDKKLQQCVKQTSLFHQGSIQFAQSSKQMIFTVNNLSKDDDDFQKIRSTVQLVVEKKCYTEFTVQCPSSWLIFSLILRAKHKSNRVLKIEDCFKIAQECGISSYDELTTALSFIHSRLGLVRFFNVEELDSLVIIDPQVLFDKITDLIVETFVSENAEENEIQEFREKGIIPVKVMERISNKSNTESDASLPFKWLINLLNHLRIAAFFKDIYGEKYFFPSVLCHVPEAQDTPSNSPPPKSRANQPPSMLIAFETGFCPRGIAGALIKCLMTNEMRSSRKWELLPNKIFRNQVSFHIEARYDVTIKVLPTHLEVSLDSKTDISKPRTKLTCEEAYTQISESMKIVTKMYRRCEYFFTYYCTLPECASLPHPAAIEWDNSSFDLRCKVVNDYADLPNGYELWNIQKQHKQPGVSLLDRKIEETSLGLIADSMTEWTGSIAEHFGLTRHDTATIMEKYPKNLPMQLREALQTWKQRHGDTATFSKLIAKFKEAGYQNYADNVKKIGLQSSNSDPNCSGVQKVEQPPIYTNGKTKSECQQPPATSKPSEAVHVMIVEESTTIGDRGEVCSEKVLESGNVSFIPDLSPRKPNVKGAPDEQRSSKEDDSEAEESSSALSEDKHSADVQSVTMATEDKTNSSADSALDTGSMITDTTMEGSKFSEDLLDKDAKDESVEVSEANLDAEDEQHSSKVDVSEAEQSSSTQSKNHTTPASTDVESVSTATAKDKESTATVTTGSTIEGSKGRDFDDDVIIEHDETNPDFKDEQQQPNVDVTNAEQSSSALSKDKTTVHSTDVESVAMATAKDRESTATSVATESTTEESKDFETNRLSSDSDNSSDLQLHQAALNGQLEEVRRLVQEEKLDPMDKDQDGDTALHCAAYNGHLSVLKYFIEERGLDPLCRGQYGETPLHRAAEHKHLKVVQYLVGEQQVDPLCWDEDGSTSLHTACQGGDIEVIQYLISQIKKHNSMEEVMYDKMNDGRTAVHLAAFYGYLHIVKLFISEFNFDPNTPGWQGRSFLHDAAQEGSLETVKWLIEEQQCNPASLDNYNYTPLHCASMAGRLNIIDYLINETHCDPLSTAKNGDTPLHLAAYYGELQAVKHFVEVLKCEPNIMNNANETPLDLARDKGHTSVVQYLMSFV